MLHKEINMEFIIKYQPVPYNYTTPSVMVVDASSKVEAWVAAYDSLTRQGLSVHSTDYDMDRVLTDEEVKAARELGVPDMSGRVMIRELREYKVKAVGTVKSQGE
jgi:hypothetical protein